MQLFYSSRKIAGILKSIILPFHDYFIPRLPHACKGAAILQKAPGSLQDRGAGTVIDGEGQLFCPVFMFQGIKNLKRTAPPAIDHLIGISHGKKIGASADQPVKENKLLAVTVLDLVYNDPFGRRRISNLLPQKKIGIFQQVKKGHFVLTGLFLPQQTDQIKDIVLIF